MEAYAVSVRLSTGRPRLSAAGTLLLSLRPHGERPSAQERGPDHRREETGGRRGIAAPDPDVSRTYGRC